MKRGRPGKCGNGDDQIPTKFGNYTLESVDSIIFYHLLVLNVGNGASWHDVESSFGLDHETPFPRALATCHGAGETPSET
jgi:hypothetical protein